MAKRNCHERTLNAKCSNGYYCDDKFCDKHSSVSFADKYCETDWNQVVCEFSELQIQSSLYEAIQAFGLRKPSIIQYRILMANDINRDLIVQSSNESDKTLGLTIAILQNVKVERVECQVLILLASHEEAEEIKHLINSFGKLMGIKCCLCTLSTDVKQDLNQLKSGVHIVIGTPGRVYDLISIGAIQTINIKLLTAIETDRLYSNGYESYICDLYFLLKSDVKIMFSTTTMKSALSLARIFCRHPIKIWDTKFFDTESSVTNCDDAFDNNETDEVWIESDSNCDEESLNFDFKKLNLKDELMKEITNFGEENFLSLHKQTLVACISPHDTIIQSCPGRAKAALLAIVALQKIEAAINQCQVLILTPMRRKADELYKVISLFGKSMNLRCHISVGGTNLSEDIKNLRLGQHIVIGTLGRLMHMVSEKALLMDFVKLVVFYDANLMFLNEDVHKEVIWLFEEISQQPQVEQFFNYF
ncbi:Eukaryotic initiation factor 4A-like protein [Dinothrombium tinctorium]|uniref:Eukaryotic initiation factor 4A-like protein n=1 Tax=Dinothrombium tinctorium TaxID=1965070 RepID=A0A3S3P4U0_9ACAR|nr:Eukaryotic initiation factor 4A-like protein [Dinothrombium tinctorium]